MALLDWVDPRPSQNAIDLGRGPRGTIEPLRDQLGPDGRVVGVDVDPVHVALAHAFVAEQGLANVEIPQTDARRTGLPAAPFDLVHARTLLITIPDPTAVMAEMTRLVRPGGWVASMEPNMAAHPYHAPHPTQDRLHEIFIDAFRADGADPFIGRHIPDLFRQAGLTNIGIKARAELYPPGHTRRTILLDLVRSMRPKIVQRGIAREQEFDDLDRAAHECLNDPCALVLSPAMFLTWGRKTTA